MSKPGLHIQTPEEAETVFYESFMHGDKAVMAALWAKEGVVCVHPGSRAITGHDAVVRSWEHILDNSQRAAIRVTEISKQQSRDLAVHIVSEEIMDNNVVMAIVVATNVYRRYEQGWLMVEHHGSVVQQARQGQTLQ